MLCPPSPIPMHGHGCHQLGCPRGLVALGTRRQPGYMALGGAPRFAGAWGQVPAGGVALLEVTGPGSGGGATPRLVTCRVPPLLGQGGGSGGCPWQLRRGSSLPAPPSWHR